MCKLRYNSRVLQLPKIFLFFVKPLKDFIAKDEEGEQTTGWAIGTPNQGYTYKELELLLLYCHLYIRKSI